MTAPLPDKFSDCKILAVSKLQSLEKIRDLYSQGQRLFAENYVQEALEKMKKLSDLKIQWHFIGHLQKNKVKLVVEKFHWIHSVDSFELAESINRISEQRGHIQKILLQVNLADEESKGGFGRDSLLQIAASLKNLKNIEILGLMAMPPLEKD